MTTIATTPMPTVVAGGRPGDFLTVRHLRLRGSNREIGQALAAAAQAVHGAKAGPIVAADHLVERARRTWFEANHPSLAERIRGVADFFGVDPEQDRFDLAWLPTYQGPAGCSAVVYPGKGTSDGHTLLARNFDFPTASFSEIVGLPPLPGEKPLAADPWIVELHPAGGLASLVIGIMDVMGAMEGVNEAGLAVALLADNESPNPEPTGGGKVGLAEQQVVRYLLDSCTTVEEAKLALLAAKHYYFFVPCHFLVADRSGASFVWEHSPGRNHERIVDADPATLGRLVCTNHLLHRWPDPAELPEEDDSLGTAAFTYRRWRTLDTAVSDGAVVDRNAIRQQFEAVRFAAPIEGARTFWHAIHDLDDPGVEVSFYLRDDASGSRYTEPRRFSL